MKFLIKFKKSISLLTTFCLLLSFVIGPTVANAMTNEEATKQYRQIFKDFILPYSYGQITSAHYAGTDRVIINIQDLHCHPQVQKNISNIIETFDKSYGVKKIYLEGAYGQVDTSWLIDTVQRENISNMLDKMLETGRLTGAEYYSAISGKSNIISGLEKKEPYLENLKRFGNIVENQEKINLIIEAIEESTKKLKYQYYTKRQFKIEELSAQYKEGNITPQKYYALLTKHIDKLGIDINKYENTFTYIRLLELQKHLDYSRVTTELQNLVLLLRESLPNDAYQLLVDNTENFSKLDKLYGYIVRISRQLNLDLSVNFAELDKYFNYIELSQKINPLELISEEEKLTEEINTRFSETKSQREVVFLTNFERYLKEYVSSKITSDDYEYYKNNIGTYKTLWNKYVDNKVLNLLNEYIAEADKFYKINTDRNIYFTENMFQKTDELNKINEEVEAKGDVNKIIENMKQVKEVDIVVTGGFHSQTVTQILKEQNVSYIVIMPNVTEGTKLAEETYYEIAKEQSKISFQALATLISSLLPVSKQQDIINLVLSQISRKNKKSLKKIKKSQLSDEEKSNLIRRLILAKMEESDDIKSILDIVNEQLSQDNQITEEELAKINTDQLPKLLENKKQLEKVVETIKSSKLKQLVELTIETISMMIDKISSLSEEQQQEKQRLQQERDSLIKNIQMLDEIVKAAKNLVNRKALGRGEYNRYKNILKDLENYPEMEECTIEQLKEIFDLKTKLINIKPITDSKQAIDVVMNLFANIDVIYSVTGYSSAPKEFGKIADLLLKNLVSKTSLRLGDLRTAIATSPTATQDSIDAIATLQKNALKIYVTEDAYVKYISPEELPEDVDKDDYFSAFKFVAKDGEIYAQTVAQLSAGYSSNVCVVIGGRDTALCNDIRCALANGNTIFVVDSEVLSSQLVCPAIEHKNLSDLASIYRVNNTSDYLLLLVDLIEMGLVDSDGTIYGIDSDKKLTEEEQEKLKEFELSEAEQEMFARLETLKKELHDNNKNKEISEEERKAKETNLRQEIEKLENELFKEHLTKIKVFYHLIKKVRETSEQSNIDNEKTVIQFLMQNGVTSRTNLEKAGIYVVSIKDKEYWNDDKRLESLYGDTAEEEMTKILDKKGVFKAIKAAALPIAGEVISAKTKAKTMLLSDMLQNNALKKKYFEEKIDSSKTPYYMLKPKYAREAYRVPLYEDGTETDKYISNGKVWINPVIAIYGPNDAADIMSKQELESRYESKGVDKDGFVEVEKKEVKVEVAFMEVGTKIESIVKGDNGESIIRRYTVKPGDIVVRSVSNSDDAWVMTIDQFLLRYPQEKNPELYEKYAQQIEQLKRNESTFADTVSQQEQIKTPTESSKSQKKQSNFKDAIKKIIITLLMFITLTGSQKGIVDTVGVQQSAITQSYVQEENLGDSLFSNSNIEDFLADEDLFDRFYYDIRNDEFAPATKEDLRVSLKASSSPEIRAFVKPYVDAIIEKFGQSFSYDNMPEIIFMKTTSTDNYFLGSAWSFSTEIYGAERNFVIIPVNYDEDGKFSCTQDILGTLAHEWTHTINSEKVRYGEMSPLEDEYLATRNGYLMLKPSDNDISFDVKGVKYTMPIYQGLRVLGFSKILDNKADVLAKFRNFRLDVKFSDLYYEHVSDMFTLENGKQALAITLYDTKDNNNKCYVLIDTDGNIIIQEKEPVIFSEYIEDEQKQSQLTMTRLGNLLDKHNIMKFDKRQKIINAIENPIIVLGMFFPTIQKWFIEKHTGQDLTQVEVGLNTIIADSGLSDLMDYIPTMNFVRKLSKIVCLLFSKKDKYEQQRQKLAEAHTAWNKKDLHVLRPIDKEIEVKKVGLKPEQEEMVRSRSVIVYDWFKNLRDRNVTRKYYRDDDEQFYKYNGFVLGLTSYTLNNRSFKFVQAICDSVYGTNLCRWFDGARHLLRNEKEIVSSYVPEQYLPKVFEDCRITGRKVYFILPPNLTSFSKEQMKIENDKNLKTDSELSSFKAEGNSITQRELDCISAHPEWLPYVEFVVGAYDCLDIQSDEVYDRYFSTKNDQYRLAKTLSQILYSPNEFMISSEIEYKSITDLVLAGINPIKEIISFIEEIFNDQKLTGEIVMVEKGQKLESLESVNEKILEYTINKDIDNVTRHGYIIGIINGKTIRVKKQGKNVVFYSKQGLNDVSKEDIEKLFMEAISSGIKNTGMRENTVVAFAESTDITVLDIENRIENAKINGIQKAEIEMSLDLTEEQNIGDFATKCIQETNSATSASTIIINAEQLEKNIKVIKELQEKGYRFILKGTMSQIEDAFSRYNLDGAILEKAVGKDVERLEEISANNVNGKIHVQTQMYIDMKTASSIDAEKIYMKYGIIPIVSASQARVMMGKCALGYKEIAGNEEKMLGKGNVLNIICDSKDGELEKARTGLSQVFDSMFATMGELLKPKSIEQRIKEEERVISDYNYRDLENSLGIIIEDVKQSLNVNENIIRRILTTEITEENQEIAEDFVNKFMEQYGTQCPSVIQMRIKTYMNKGNYIEAIGTIKGVINQTIDNILITKWKNVNREKYLNKEYEESRQYIRIRTIQLLMLGENIEDLMKEEVSSNETVEQLFDRIKTELNKDIKITIINNKNAIKEISQESKAKAISDFINMNILLQDSLLEVKSTKEMKISVSAVRSMLSAA